MKKTYPIELIKDTAMSLYYPEELSLSEIDRVAFGTFSFQAKCLPQPKGKEVISISEDLASKLKIPNFQIPIHLFRDEKILYLGPLVGIITTGFTPFPLRPIGERSLFFSKLLSVEKHVGVHAFVFGEEHIDWENGTIEGLFYHKNGWERKEVPFPNVIYDRLPNRRSEKKKELRHVKERLQNEYLIPWYNPGFFNKMEVFERLQQEHNSSKYLPETFPLTSFSLVERMLSDYGHVFIKPINGSLGLGIHQVIYDRDHDAYYCRYREKDGSNKLRKYETLEGLVRHVFRNRKLSQMLVQQGIRSIRVDNRTVDFRVHTNKDDNGNWQVTALAAKVASPGSVTTHVNNGGVIKTIAEIFQEKADQIEAVKKLKEASLLLSQSLERHMEGIIGEIGFDMGIDREGRVWLYEANSKPGRSIFKHPQLKDFDLLTRKLSLAFSVFLTEKAISNPEGIYK